MKEKYRIVHLPKEKWQGTVLPIGYTTQEYYDVAVDRQESGFTFTIRKKTFDRPVTHTPEEYDCPDRLYAEYYPEARAWGVLEAVRLVAAIETCPEIWSNRLLVTELWIDAPFRKQGLGHALMEVAKKQALREHRRAVILETQSCNVNAVDFYLHEGFTLIGLDSCCYGNNDLARKEVRLNLGWFPPQKAKPSDGENGIRPERPEERHAAE